MKFNFEMLKKRPLLIGGIIVVGGVILYMLMSRGGGSGGGGQVVAQGVDPNAVQAQTAVALAQLQAGAQVQGYQAQMQIAAAQTAGAIAIRQLDDAVSSQGVAAQLQLGLAQLGVQQAGIDANTAVQLSGIAATLQGQRDQLQTTFQLAQLSSQTTLGLGNIQAGIAMNAQDNATLQSAIQAQLFGQINTNQTAVSQAQIAAAVTQAQIASQTQIAGFNTQAQIAATQAGAQNVAARQAGSTARHGSTLGTIASLATAAFAFFSDERMKENIVHVRTRPDGLKIYRWNYVGENVTYLGVIAQEVLDVYPLAVSHYGGFLAVDYDAIGEKMERVA